MFLPLKQRSLMLSGTRNRLGRNGIQLSSSRDPWAVCLCPRESMTTFCPKLGLHVILWLRKPLHYWHYRDVLWSNRLPSASSLGTPWLMGSGCYGRTQSAPSHWSTALHPVIAHCTHQEETGINKSRERWRKQTHNSEMITSRQKPLHFFDSHLYKLACTCIGKHWLSKTKQ